jgi:bacteriocin-like protein
METNRELNDAELAAVSGGTSDMINAVARVVLGEPAPLPQTLPCDAFDIICRIIS